LAFSSSQAKKKKCKEKKTIEKKKYAQRGGSLLSSSHSALSLLAPAFALLCQVLSLGIFFFSSRRKDKKHKEKKNRRKETKCREGKEFTFKLSLCPFIFGSCFCPLAYTLSFQVLLKTIRKKKTRKRKEFTFLLLPLHLG